MFVSEYIQYNIMLSDAGLHVTTDNILPLHMVCIFVDSQQLCFCALVITGTV